MDLFGRDLGTGLDHDWRRCERQRCAEALCQVYWAGHADGEAAGYGEGHAAGREQGQGEGWAAHEAAVAMGRA